MNTLRKRQDDFLSVFNSLPGWTERFHFLIDHSSLLDPECPPGLRPFRIDSCRNRAYFKAEVRAGDIYVAGWSAAAITGGLIAVCMKIFDGLPASSLAGTEIDFHTRSGLSDAMTPVRSDALREIIRRITVLSSAPQNPHL